jgi:hypothetical protein
MVVSRRMLLVRQNRERLQHEGLEVAAKVRPGEQFQKCGEANMTQRSWVILGIALFLWVLGVVVTIYKPQGGSLDAETVIYFSAIYATYKVLND